MCENITRLSVENHGKARDALRRSDTDQAAMRLDNGFGDGQAEPSTIGGRMSTRGVGAVEAVKQSR